jgi:hypothetical protein
LTEQELAKIIKEWTQIKIEGKLVNRIRYNPKQGDPGKCSGCGVTKSKLHKLGCNEEKLTCSRGHLRLIDCDCSYDGENQV